MTEILYYQLHQPIEKALPVLLEKTLQRGWKAVIRVGEAERLPQIDDALWVFNAESFLPHGRLEDDNAAMQPVLLTQGGENANDAQVLFLVENADVRETREPSGYIRVVLMFDGSDDKQLMAAREAWKATRSNGFQASYYQQSETGGWDKKG